MNTVRTLAAFALLIPAILPNVARAHDSCLAGTVDGFSCSHIELLGHLDTVQLGANDEALQELSDNPDAVDEISDMWGWTDPASKREFVILGFTTSTAFAEILPGGEAIYLGKIDYIGEDHSGNPFPAISHWQDIKVYGNHAYIVSEAGISSEGVVGGGLRIFDMTHLLDVSTPQEFEPDARFEDIDGAPLGHVHNIFINEDSARAYIARTSQNELVVLDISSPLDPRLLYHAAMGNRTPHDIYCEVYEGPDSEHAGKEICLTSGKSVVDVIDFSNPPNPHVLGSTVHEQAVYVHQGWITPDKTVFYINDEQDETTFGLRTRTLVYDISDLDNIRVASEYRNHTKSIDHNLYISPTYPDLMFQSNYMSGLRILDIRNPQRPLEIGYLDTRDEDGFIFGGTWSNYPFFSSGHVAFTDMRKGLFILKPELSDVPEKPDLRVAAKANRTASGSYDVSFAIANDSDIAATDIVLRLSLPLNGTFSGLYIDNQLACVIEAEDRVLTCRMDYLEPCGIYSGMVETAHVTERRALIASVAAHQLDDTSGDNHFALPFTSSQLTEADLEAGFTTAVCSGNEWEFPTPVYEGDNSAPEQPRSPRSSGGGPLIFLLAPLLAILASRSRQQAVAH